MFSWILQNTVLAALFAVGVAVFCRLARPNPAVRHTLWLLVLLRLLMPPALYWPWEVPLPQREVAVATQPAAPAEPVLTSTVVGEEELMVVDEAVAEQPAAAATPVTIEAAPAVHWSIWLARLATVAWLGGAAFVALRHLARMFRLYRAARLGLPGADALIARVSELAGKLGIRPPRVLLVPGLASPLVGCLPRPVLLWPEGLEDRLSSEGLRAVLAHELAHLRRRDHWVRWLELSAECLWWWNPLFLIVRRKIRQNAELACDAWVLTLLPKARRAYAEALLTVCETVSRAAEPMPALGVGGDDRRDFQKRLTMIMREPVGCTLPRKALLAVGLLAALAVPGWTLGRTVADPQESTAPPPSNGDTRDWTIELKWVEAGDLLLDLVDATEKTKAQPASDDRDKKLQELEVKIQAILKEVQALRQQDNKTISGWRLKDLEGSQRGLLELAQRQDLTARRNALSRLAQSAPATATKTRQTYTLAPDKAKALETFLKTYFKAAVTETKLEDDKLTTTATADAQKAIAELVKLMQDPDRVRYRQYEKTTPPPEREKLLLEDLRNLERSGVRSQDFGMDRPIIPPPPKPEPRRGQVKGVSGDLTTFSLGSDDGLKKDDVLQVYRLSPRATWLGTLRAVEVQRHQAVGRFSPATKITTIMNGDTVDTRVTR